MMQTITVKTAELSPWPRNYNRHDERQITALAASLRTFGQFKNIVVARRGGRLFTLAGHGLVEAAQRAGIAELEAALAPDDWPDEKLEALLAADNRLAQLAQPDDALLAELLQAVRAADADLLPAVGFDSAEIDDLLRQVAAADEPPDVEFREYDETAADTVEWRECPKCGHRWPK